MGARAEFGLTRATAPVFRAGIEITGRTNELNLDRFQPNVRETILLGTSALIVSNETRLLVISLHRPSLSNTYRTSRQV
jgi:hypothetical protein